MNNLASPENVSQAAGPVGSAPLAWTLHLGCNKGFAEVLQICPPLPFLLFHGKNNRAVRRNPRSISRDDRRPQSSQDLQVFSNLSYNWNLGLGKYGRLWGRSAGYRGQAGGCNSWFLDLSTWVRADMEDKLAQTLADLTRRPEYGAERKCTQSKPHNEAGSIQNSWFQATCLKFQLLLTWGPCTHFQHLKCITYLL